MDIETITWVFIGFSAAVYVGARHLAESKKVTTTTRVHS